MPKVKNVLNGCKICSVMHKGDKLFVAVPSDENRASKNISGLQRNIAYDQFNDARNNSI